MIFRFCFGLLLSGCTLAAGVAPADPPPPPFKACQALPPALPKVRTIEAVVARLDDVEHRYADCAERLRRVVEAYERLSAQARAKARH